MQERPVSTGFSGATEPMATGRHRFGCGCGTLGIGWDRLRSSVAPFRVEKPDRTRTLNTRCSPSFCHYFFHTIHTSVTTAISACQNPTGEPSLHLPVCINSHVTP